MNTFKIPENIYFGEKSMDALKTLKGKKAIIVTGGSSMKKFGFIEQTERILAEGGFETTIFDGVEPNPSVDTVNRGAEAMRAFGADWIVAIGGGSAIDAAKIMWCFYEHPDLTFEDIIPVCSMPELRKKAKFAAIPSTSGTATEITAFSVITDTKKHIKYPIVSPHIVPDVAIVDPALPAKMPPHITVHTGMDVMTHALEAYASTASNDYSDPLAIRAIKLTFENLESAYKDGDDMVARDKMHNASTLAGMAFSNVSLGLCHSLAHKIGGEFGVTHGLANAILLPYVVEYNKKFIDKFEFLERILNLGSMESALFELNQKLGIPRGFKDITEVEVTEERFMEVLDRMSENAFNDPCTLTNPGEPSVEVVKEIYLNAFRGE